MNVKNSYSEMNPSHTKVLMSRNNIETFAPWPMNTIFVQIVAEMSLAKSWLQVNRMKRLA